MKLGKPPIVEAWIGFIFNSNTSKKEWDIKAAEIFFDRYKEAMPVREAVHNLELQVREVSRHMRPEVIGEQQTLLSIRAHTVTQDRWLQLADDRLVYNLVLPGRPAFQILLEEAFEKLDGYVDVFSPQSVKNSELHYVDIIEIPCNAGEALALKDYFHLTTDLSEDPFGKTVYFETQFVLEAEPRPDTLQVRLQSLPDSSPTCLRVRIDWHRICANIDSLEHSVIRARMNAAHEHLRKCFRASVTDQTWKLFEPEHGDGDDPV